MNNKALSHLGLAQRAGKLVSGDENVMKLIRSGQAKLVLMAVDASENTRKKYRDKCEFYTVPFMECFSRAELGLSLGKAERVIIAITDRGFAEMIKSDMAKFTEVEHIEQSRKR